MNLRWKEAVLKVFPYLKEGFFFVVYYILLSCIWLGTATKAVLLFLKDWGTKLSTLITEKYLTVKHGKFLKRKYKINLLDYKVKLGKNYTALEKTVIKSKNSFASRYQTFVTHAASFVSRTGKSITLHKGEIGFFAIGVALLLLFISGWQGYLFIKSLPSPKNIGKLNYPTSTHIYDRNGNMLYEIYKEENRTPVKLDALPDYVSQATIATEDKDFYKHNGVSIVGGVLRAAKDTYLTHELQGGSTITQQLVKSALLTPERTIARKVKEMILAVWTEQLYTKDQILEMYLNQVPYGGSAYGIEEASKTYFDKPAKNLTLEEAALLAGLPRAPSVYSPYVNPERAQRRRNDVLKRMLQEKFITQEQYDASIKKTLTVVPPKIDINAPHFVFYIKQELERQYGASVVEEGGLRVKTTLDLEIQKEAEKILKEEIAKVSYLNITNGAILVTKPSTGEIVAMVGSLDYYAQPHGAFNVTTGLRQPGSTIKAVMYSLALENGFTAASVIQDQPLVISIPGSEPYRPVNYDGRYHGNVPLRMALANSYNIPAVKVLQTLGVQQFVNHAEKMGIDTWKDSSRFGLSLTLGGGEVTMVDMAESFGVFANTGRLQNLTGIQDIQNLYGEKLDYDKPFARQVLDEGVAYIISDILADNLARQQAFGANSALEIRGYKASVKTGTTNELKDNWTIGYTPDYLVTVWVGNNDNTPMNPYLVSGITGAAPIWNRMMTYLLQKDYPNKQNKWIEKPSDIVERICYGGRVEYFLAGTENSVACGGVQQNGQWNRWNQQNQFNQWNQIQNNGQQGNNYQNGQENTNGQGSNGNGRWWR